MFCVGSAGLLVALGKRDGMSESVFEEMRLFSGFVGSNFVFGNKTDARIRSFPSLYLPNTDFSPFLKQAVVFRPLSQNELS